MFAEVARARPAIQSVQVRDFARHANLAATESYVHETRTSASAPDGRGCGRVTAWYPVGAPSTPEKREAG